jgi:hypothetical protein
LKRSRLIVADRNRLARTESRRQLDFLTHDLGRIRDEQAALVVVAHFEYFRRRLLASHVPFAKLLIDNHLHWILSLPRADVVKNTII